MECSGRAAMLHAIAEVDSNEDHSQKQSAPELLSSDGSLSGKAAPLRSAEQKAAASLSEGDRSPVLVHGAGGQVSRG